MFCVDFLMIMFGSQILFLDFCDFIAILVAEFGLFWANLDIH
jgi:hypothetical protein